jgi:UTP-glucose-1-phosphate uridylyltransferase
MKDYNLYGKIIIGERLDFGNPLGFIKGNIIAGLNNEKYSHDLIKFMKSIIEDL